MREFIQAMPENLPFYVLIVLHLREEATEIVVKNLANISKLPVYSIHDKQVPKAGSVYVAPGGYHVLMEGNGQFSLSLDDPVLNCRPSIDVILCAFSLVLKSRLWAVLLTGANTDGAQGLLEIKRAKGHTWAQSLETAEAKVMPAKAIELNAACSIASPKVILETLLARILAFQGV
ncbi:MAG: chemotaxis protein CheB [Gammaproteobacteria bacterium]|nr:chemotaxis protein CheB [Gammaproteobacteria bacterium]